MTMAAPTPREPGRTQHFFFVNSIQRSLRTRIRMSIEQHHSFLSEVFKIPVQEETSARDIFLAESSTAPAVHRRCRRHAQADSMQNQIEAGKVNGAEFGRSSIAVVTRMLCLLHMYFKIAFSSFHPPKVFFTFLITLPRIPSFFNTCTGASTRFIFFGRVDINGVGGGCLIAAR